jgi:acetylornithine deacetylase
MGRVIAALETFDRHDLRLRVHPLVGPASMHCALIRGGTGLSTYAQECCLELERRTLPGETVTQVSGELEQVIAKSGVEASLDCFFDRPPLTCDPQSVVARTVRGAIADVTGRAAEEAGVQYWMDAAIFAEAGIPTVNYGPTGAGAHEAIEWVDIASVAACANVLAAAALRFCHMEAVPSSGG